MRTCCDLQHSVLSPVAVAAVLILSSSAAHRWATPAAPKHPLSPQLPPPRTHLLWNRPRNSQTWSDHAPVSSCVSSECDWPALVVLTLCFLFLDAALLLCTGLPRA